jgi:signal peptidase II
MLPYILIILAFVADRVTKLWAAENLTGLEPVEINDFLTFYATYNRGVAFGLAQGIGPVIGWLSIFIVIGLFVHLWRTPKRMWLLRIGLAMIIGGALGNMIDRITAGEVLDFIQVSFLPGIFNISDVMVNAGMVVSLAAVFLHPEHEEAIEEPAVIEPDRIEVESLEPVMDGPVLVDPGAAEAETVEPERADLAAAFREQPDFGESYLVAADQEGDEEQQKTQHPGRDPQPGFPIDVEQSS